MRPVQVGFVNRRLFLVNASVGLYPDLLEDREVWKNRFGRSQWVAIWAALATLLRAQKRLKLKIELEGGQREVHTLTLFVGNNRLQLEQVGVVETQAPDGARDNGRVTAVVLKPIGTWSMVGLLLQGAMGRLGEAAGVDSFEFQQMVVRPTLAPGRTRVSVAYDGEVSRMRPPIVFQVLDRPLYLLRPAQAPDAAEVPA